MTQNIYLYFKGLNNRYYIIYSNISLSLYSFISLVILSTSTSGSLLIMCQKSEINGGCFDPSGQSSDQRFYNLNLMNSCPDKHNPQCSLGPQCRDQDTLLCNL